MSARIRLEIEGNDFFSGYLLDEGKKRYTIGTDISAALKIDAAALPAPVCMLFETGSRLLKSDGGSYFSRNSSEKLSAVRLAEKDSVTVSYISGERAFLLSVLPDPELGLPAVTEKLSLAGRERLSVGCQAECDVKIAHEIYAGSGFTLQSENGEWKLLCSGRTALLRADGHPVREKEIRNPSYILAGGIPFFLVEDMLYYPGSMAEAADGQSVFREENGTYPVFRDGPRRMEKLQTAEIRIPAPEKECAESAAGMLRSVLPGLILMAGLFLYSRLSGGNTVSWFGIFSVGAGLAAVLIGFTAERLRTHADKKKHMKAYAACLQDKESEIRQACSDELERMNRMYRSSAENLESVRSFSPELFERRPGSGDFMQVCLGRGGVPARTQVVISEEAGNAEKKAGQLLPAELKKKYELLKNAPVVLDGRNIRTAGICGTPDVQDMFFHVILLDLITRQHPDDLKCSFFLREKEAKQMAFLQNLPEAKDGCGRNIAWNRENAERLAGKLYGELKRKDAAPFQAVFVTNRELLSDHPLCSLMKQKESGHGSFFFFAGKPEELPEYTEVIVSGDADNAVFSMMSGEKPDISFRPFQVSREELQEAVRILAPVCSAEKQAGLMLERKASLMQLPGITDIRKNWEESLKGEQLRVPVGFDERQEPVYIDLHEKADGPHAILAGDSGSGKSELLFTYILSAAAHFHPAVLNFFVIDFKGGGLSGRMKGLPHLNGCITDMDSYETGRAVKAIRAEIKRREKLFSDVSVSHIDDYRKACTDRADVTVLPHLVIIVDEFAEMKREYPQILDDLISAARVGRSLGIHLILATQKPAGQISEQIGSNARLRLCLRVRSAEDSLDMLRTPIACEIRERGRGILQTGSNERFEIFQTAYSGMQAEEPGMRRKYAVWETAADGSRKLVGEPGKDMRLQRRTEADRLMEELQKAGGELEAALPGTMLPPSLPESLTSGDLPQKVPADSHDLFSSALGMIDRPDLQQRDMLRMNQLYGNILIAGDAGSGKTETLILLIRLFEENFMQEGCSMYIIDCGGGKLKQFEELSSVGGAVLPGENEKCARLFSLMEKELNERRSFGKRTKILVLIDELKDFASDFPEVQERFRDLLRRGPAAGICFAAAVESTAGTGSGILRSFDSRLIFGLRDSMESLELLGRNAPERKKVPGRALLRQDGKYFECQIIRAFQQETDPACIENWIAGRKSICLSKRAPEIPVLPEKVSFRAAGGTGKEKLLLGISCDEVLPVIWNLKYDPVLILTGGEDKEQEFFAAGLKEYLTGDRETELIEFDSNTEREICRKLRETLTQAEEDCIKEKACGGTPIRKIILISGEEAYTKLSADRELIGLFAKILGKAGKMKLNFILADVPNELIGFQSPELLRTVRDRMQVLFFEPASAYRLTERFGRRTDGDFSDGKDAVFFSGNDAVRVRFCRGEAVGK